MISRISVLSSLAAFSLLLALNSCQKKDPFSITEAEMVTDMKENQNFQKIVDYGQSIGLGRDSTLYRERGMLAFLEELGYGHKPAHIRHFEEILPPDSVRVQTAGWELAQGKDIDKAMENLEPPYEAYKSLKKHYKRLVESSKPDSAAMVSETLNAYRWMHRQSRGSERMVLVNINGAYLVGLDSLGNEELRMNVIVGKSNTRTPGLDTYATNVITFPYWNIPKSIALGEMLPRIRENVYYLERNGIEVLDRKGKAVDPTLIDWSSISEGDFPYRFRQDTGEGNSLGLMKVNLQNPYAIYLHDTDVRSLFGTDQRWRSHGCVRLEKPAQLANFIAGEKIVDENFVEEALAAPEIDRKPKTYSLKKKVPTFLYFLPADVDKAGNLIYYKDVYDLVKKVV
ncbi:L,D-transpeptidase family protein [Persicitalea sp.]|uniref:L,D-transpeptidase family protein n=1 Tax=Persicitalea sp. TaxID=3100273 RepID=UPI0035930C77